MVWFDDGSGGEGVVVAVFVEEGGGDLHWGLGRVDLDDSGKEGCHVGILSGTFFEHSGGEADVNRPRGGTGTRFDVAREGDDEVSEPGHGITLTPGRTHGPVPRKRGVGRSSRRCRLRVGMTRRKSEEPLRSQRILEQRLES